MSCCLADMWSSKYAMSQVARQYMGQDDYLKDGLDGWEDKCGRVHIVMAVSHPEISGKPLPVFLGFAERSILVRHITSLAVACKLF
jgi:hypothetical protein